MNSLFDPECQRQILGNRQEAEELNKRERKKGERQGREEEEPVMQGGLRSVATEALGRQSLPEHRFPPAGEELGDGKQPDCCYIYNPTA